MKSSFHRGRSIEASMAARARRPEKQVTPGAGLPTSSPKIRDKDATELDPRALGAALRFFRGNRSLASVARAAGLKRDQLTAIEKGQAKARPETVHRVCHGLGVEVARLQALAGLLGLAPVLLDPTAGPLGQEGLETGFRWAELVRASVPALLPFLPVLPERGRFSPSEVAWANLDAADLWERLQPWSATERRALVEEGVEYRVWPLSELLCGLSLETASDDPAKAVELARLAELIASLGDGSEAERSLRSGYCTFHISNAHRAAGSLDDAELALQRAEPLWKAGAGDHQKEPHLAARVLGLKASLRREQRQLGEALALLREALSLGSAKEAKYLFLSEAKTFEEIGLYERAITSLHQALPHLDAERDTRLLLIQRFNLNANFCRLGRYADADNLLEEMQELAEKTAKGVAQLRIVWMRGWIAAGMGRLEEAEAALGSVREEFLARNIGYDAALASLDLARLYLQQGRTAEVKALADQVVVVFREQGVDREAQNAVELFQQAVAAERASVELAVRLADYLRRSRQEGAVRFAG